MVHHSVCPLCDSSETGFCLAGVDYFLSKEPYDLYRCSSCGFVFTQDHPAEDKIGKYYDSDEYISHDESVTGFSNSVYRIARDVMLKRKRSVVNKITMLRAGSLLDIGSGTGHFLSVMKRSGWKTKGIEVNEKARGFSIAHFGLDVMPPEQILSLPDSTFDCITLWHVLEHFQNPFKYAAEIRRLLKPGGICLIALPNCSSYDADYYGKEWAAWDVPRHLWHFNPDTFRLFTEKAGFELTGIMRLPLDVFYISTLSEKYKNSGISFLSGILKGLWFSTRTLFNKEKSSSLIYVLMKPS
jgi:SAM-dependent methyltransferase